MCDTTPSVVSFQDKAKHRYCMNYELARSYLSSASESQNRYQISYLGDEVSDEAGRIFSHLPPGFYDQLTGFRDRGLLVKSSKRLWSQTTDG